MMQLACVNSTGSGGTESTQVTGLTALTTYFVRVWHSATGSGSTGEFTICAYGGADDDISVQNPNVSPTTVAAGGAVDVSCDQVYLTGATSTLDVNVGYYLSTNCSLGIGDVLLGTDLSNIGTSDPADGESATVTIPSGTAAGSYFILFVADYDGLVAESNESNNVLCVPITVTTGGGGSDDIGVSNATASVTGIAPGGTVDVDCNQIYVSGTTSTLDVNLGYFLSTNCDFGPGDVLLGTDFSNIGTSDLSDIESATLTIPGATAPGTYYILFVADYDGLIAEANESNNVQCVQIIVCNTDLVPLLVTQLPLTICAGSSVMIDYGILNDGCADVPTIEWSYYRSNDAILDGGDVDFGSGNAFNVLSGETFTNDVGFFVPGGTPPGTIYFLFVVDPDDIVAEGLGEGNNVLVVPVNVVAGP
ncbi:MAG: CARDB domain-containing protein, partial [Flavobacteriales bacterium]